MQTNDTDVAIMLNRPTLPLKEENLKAIESFVEIHFGNSEIRLLHRML